MYGRENLTRLVDGLDIVIGTSPQLMQHSHGKSMDYIRVRWQWGIRTQ